MEIRDYALLAAEAALDKNADDVIILDVAPVLVITDYFVIATGASDTQVKAIADEMEARVEGAGLQVRGREGEQERRWVLLDFGDLVVHVFQPEMREFYRLEKLYGDVERVPVPNAGAQSGDVAAPDPGGAAQDDPAG